MSPSSRSHGLNTRASYRLFAMNPHAEVGARTTCSNPVPHIQSLISINRDSAKAFEHAADLARNPDLASIFRRLRDERRHQLHELMALVDLNVAELGPGSIAAAVHRWWLSVKTALADGDDAIVLKEVLRSEIDISRAYALALHDIAAPVIHQLLSRHYLDVTRALFDLRALLEGLPPHPSPQAPVQPASSHPKE